MSRRDEEKLYLERYKYSLDLTVDDFEENVLLLEVHFAFYHINFVE